MYIGVILFSIIFGVVIICLVVTIIVIARNDGNIHFDDSYAVIAIIILLMLLCVFGIAVIGFLRNIQKSKNAAQIYSRKYNQTITAEDVFYNKELIEKVFINKGEEK